MTAKTPYQLLGAEKVKALATHFYKVMDELTEVTEIREMHAHNKDMITEKLYEYLTGWMGGPPLYQDKYGSVCLTEPHKRYPINADHRDQWLRCMDEALKRIDASEQVTAMLKEPMYNLADFIKNSD
ncbi:MAG: group II truncated hemoglobin [Cellvibrionaceae bacterium]